MGAVEPAIAGPFDCLLALFGWSESPELCPKCGARMRLEHFFDVAIRAWHVALCDGSGNPAYHHAIHSVIVECEAIDLGWLPSPDPECADQVLK